MQKFVLVIGFYFYALFLAGQKEPFVFHKKLSTWGDTVNHFMPGDIPSVSFSPDEKTLVAGNTDGDLLVWDVGTGKVLHNLSDLNKHRQIYSIVHSPDGKYFVSVGSQSPHKYITLWKTKEFIPVKTVYYDTKRPYAKDLNNSIFGRFVFTALFSKDGKYIVTADDEGYINTWKAGSLKLISSINTDHSVWQLKMHPKKDLVFSTAENGSVKIWSFNNGHLNLQDSIKMISFRFFFMGGYSVAAVQSIGVSGNQYISSNHIDTLKITNFVTKETRFIHDIKDSFDYVEGVAFSLDGKYFASSYNRNNIKLWSADSFHLLQSVQGDLYKIEDLSNEVDYVSTEPLFSPSSIYIALLNDAGFIYLYKLNE